MKYFIDCGSHHGEKIKKFIDLYKIGQEWKIYSFEPNKESYNILKSIDNGGYDINPLNAGIWKFDGELLFNPETTQKHLGGKNDGEVSTFMNLDNWRIKHSGNPGAGDFNDSYKIDVVNLSRFLKELDDPEYVLLKMDIEGSEYDVLRHLISESSISIINDLYVEFHDWAMLSEDSNSTRLLLDQIRSHGVNIRNYACGDKL
jgi:FkbM family methyltransferase